EPERGEADVFVLMPRGQRTAWVWSEGADALHLEHRPEQHRPVMRVGVHESLRMLRIQNMPLLVSLVEPVGGRHVGRADRPVPGGPRLMPVLVRSDRGSGLL